MESGGRKILPRIQPSGAKRDAAAAGVTVAPTAAAGPPTRLSHPESTRNGEDLGTTEVSSGQFAVWNTSMEEEAGAPRRKKQHVEDTRSQSQTLQSSTLASQTLPSVRNLLTAPPANVAVDAVSAHAPARLVRLPNGLYQSQGVFIFLAPDPGREFPAAVAMDQRELSFAVLESELMDIFKHAWYLRQYVRQRRSQGHELWLDHILLNDAYGIENALHTWSSRYEPGTPYYPASMLYKNCLWLYFNRSIQTSQPTAGFAQVVEDGLHYLRTLESLIGNADRSILLVPLFLLGSTAFYPQQRREIFEALGRLDAAGGHTGAAGHAVTILESIWGTMDEGRVGITWDWERFQNIDATHSLMDRSLCDLLRDPYAPEYHQSRVRSPESFDLEMSRFRAAPGPPAPPPGPMPQAAPQQVPIDGPRHSSGDTDAISPTEQASPPRPSHPGPSDTIRVEAQRDLAMGQSDMMGIPRPFVAPPPPPSSMHASMQSSGDLYQALSRKSTKSKSSVPPCPTCGKELKNPSDAQKHHLQHSKPFLCREPGCTRVQGFATENDLQRHRKSVHGASPRIGNKIGYICAACPEPSDGTHRKWWPRLDNFKAHIRRKHNEKDEEALIQASASARRPEDSYSDSGYPSASYGTPERQQLHPHKFASAPSIMSVDTDGGGEVSIGRMTRRSEARERRDHSRNVDRDDEDRSVGPLELTDSVGRVTKSRGIANGIASFRSDSSASGSPGEASDADGTFPTRDERGEDADEEEMDEDEDDDDDDGSQPQMGSNEIVKDEQ